MGKGCSKCYKTKQKKMDDYNFGRKDSGKISESGNQINLNDPNMIRRGTIESDNKKLERYQEEEKESKHNNWDNYFTKEQIKYYDKLYETEAFDRRETKLIKRFKKGELIGQGSFGKVYQGFDEDQGRLIAIKEIDIRNINKKNLQHIASVELEIDILSKLNHKYTVKYFGVVRSEQYLNILLEYCIGGSVSKLLETYKSLSESIIRKYTQQILEGLEYLHCHNIIHRDIKGANILVDRDGICKLSDFGGAKIIEEEIDIRKQSFKGTPNWMAPETVKKLEYSRFSDIWSLGCTVIEMSTGEPPWSEHKNPMAVLYQIYHAREPPNILSHLSTELKDFIKCCMKIEPRDRWNVYKLLRHPFITGDVINFNNSPNSNNSPIGKSEFENKFCSEDKNSRLYDTFKFDSTKKDKFKNKEDIIDTSQISPVIIKKTSSLSPIRVIKGLNKDAENSKDLSTLEVVSSKRKSEDKNFKFDNKYPII